MEGNQLKNIQEIEYSLNIMRSRIQKMGEIEGTNGKALNRLLEQTTPILARKMHQVDLYQRQQAKASRNARINDEQHNINKQNRMLDQREICRAQEMLLIVKKNNSRHLKLRTKQNEVIIEQKRKMELEAKRKIKERVVQSQAIAQERIHIYHLVRKESLKQKREEENKVNQQRINHLLREMHSLTETEKAVQSRVKQSSQTLKKFRTIVRTIDKMKQHQFNVLKKKVIKDKEALDNTNLLLLEKLSTQLKELQGKDGEKEGLQIVASDVNRNASASANARIEEDGQAVQKQKHSMLENESEGQVAEEHQISIQETDKPECAVPQVYELKITAE